MKIRAAHKCIFTRRLLLLGIFLSGAPALANPFFSNIPLGAKNWSLAYHGFGTAALGAESIQIEPMAPEQPSDTHAVLLLSNKVFPSSGYEIEVDFELLRQLRAFDPHPWETFWLFFQYRAGPAATKKTNYFLLKTNGVEAGRAWGRLDQSFVLTKETPRIAVGARTTLRVSVGKKRVTFFYNDALIGSLPRNSLFQQPGKLGLYAEDAVVRVDAVRVRKISKLNFPVRVKVKK